MLHLLIFLFSFSIFSLSLSFLLFSLRKKPQRTELSNYVPKTQNLNESNLIHLTHDLPSNSSNGAAHDDRGAIGSGTDVDRIDSGGEECGVKKKKKKKGAKKNKPNKDEFQLDLKEKPELVCLYPFTSSSRAMYGLCLMYGRRLAMKLYACSVLIWWCTLGYPV